MWFVWCSGYKGIGIELVEYGMEGIKYRERGWNCRRRFSNDRVKLSWL